MTTDETKQRQVPLSHLKVARARGVVGDAIVHRDKDASLAAFTWEKDWIQPEITILPVVASTYGLGLAGPAKRIYSITKAGEAYLKFWAQSLDQYQKTMNTFFRLYTGQPIETGKKHEQWAIRKRYSCRPCWAVSMIRKGVLEVVNVAQLKLPRYMNEYLTRHNLHLVQGGALHALLHERVPHPTKLRVAP